MSWVCSGVLIALLLGQQQPPDNAAVKTPANVSSSARAKARELLEQASQTVAAAQPEIHALALYHLGYIYETLDKKKALDLYRQAFTSTTALTNANDRSNVQGRIAGRVAHLSVPDASEMLRAMPTSPEENSQRNSVVQDVVSTLVAQSKLDEAIELVESAGATGAYPLHAVDRLLAKIPPDDPRRVILFGSAIRGYTLQPTVDFPDFLTRHWREMPQDMAGLALDAVVKRILDAKDEEGYNKQIVTSKGEVNFTSRQDSELFSIIHVVRALDPKRADEILKDHAALRSALERFPGGQESMNQDSTNSMTSVTIRSASGGGVAAYGSVTGPGVGPGGSSFGSASMQEYMRNETRASEAFGVLKKDPHKALEIAATISDTATKARLLGAIARSTSETDPAIARGVLDQTFAILKDVPLPSDRVEIWISLAEAAWKITDEKLAWDAIDHAMADATALYKLDADSETPNLALREYWPSTQAFRHVVSAATKLLGVDAEPLLEKIQDPDLHLFAQIEMAGTLLARPGMHSGTVTNRQPKKQK